MSKEFDKEVSAEVHIQMAERNQKLIKQVFNTAAGSELLEIWKKNYVFGLLYSKNESDMIYNVASRDFVIEIMAAAERIES